MKGSQLFASFVAKWGMMTNIAQNFQIGAMPLGNTEIGKKQMARSVLINRGHPVVGKEMKMVEIEMQKMFRQQ